jgi:hypothetical protein
MTFFQFERTCSSLREIGKTIKVDISLKKYVYREQENVHDESHTVDQTHDEDVFSTS